MGSSKPKNGIWINNSIIPPSPAHMVVLRKNKQLIFEREYPNCTIAIENARKFYNKSDAHEIRINVSGKVVFHFVSETRDILSNDIVRRMEDRHQKFQVRSQAARKGME